MTTTPALWRSPFTLNSTLAGSQNSGVVAATTDNQFFAVWVDAGQVVPGVNEIIGRGFDSQGNPVTGQVVLHDFVIVNEGQPAAVRLPIAGQADGLAVAFTVTSPGANDVWVVRFDANLAGLPGNAILIDTVDNVEDPSITSFATVGPALTPGHVTRRLHPTCFRHS